MYKFCCIHIPSRQVCKLSFLQGGLLLIRHNCWEKHAYQLVPFSYCDQFLVLEMKAAYEATGEQGCYRCVVSRRSVVCSQRCRQLGSTDTVTMDNWQPYEAGPCQLPAQVTRLEASRSCTLRVQRWLPGNGFRYPCSCVMRCVFNCTLLCMYLLVASNFDCPYT